MGCFGSYSVRCEHQIVIDLEFTPVPKGRRKGGLRNEIIEIGAVKLDAHGNAVDSFSRFVRPQFSDIVDSDIQGLTGIRTCDVSTADTLGWVLADFAVWIGTGSARIAAWSKSDRRQVMKECAVKGIEVPKQMRRWLDLQVVYPRLMGVGNGRLMPLRAAADWYGVALDASSAHRALYDARVTAELMRLLLTGEYRQQKTALEQSMPRLGGLKPVASTLGETCGALGDLLHRMLAEPL